MLLLTLDLERLDLSHLSNMDIEAVKVLLQAQERTLKTAMDLVMEQMKSRIQTAEGTIVDLTKSLEFTQGEVRDLQSEVKVLKKNEADNKVIIETLKFKNDELERRTNYQEDYNRRNNLRITGIQEKASETWEETAKTVGKILEEKLQLPPIKLERAHRTGPPTASGPRTVVARLERFCDREAVLRNARKLKGTGIYINEDLCPASQELKRQQLPLLKQAREQGKIAFFRHTRLIIKERLRPGFLEHDVSVGGAPDGDISLGPRSGAGDGGPQRRTGAAPVQSGGAVGGYDLPLSAPTGAPAAPPAHVAGAVDAGRETTSADPAREGLPLRRGYSEVAGGGATPGGGAKNKDTAGKNLRNRKK